MKLKAIELMELWLFEVVGLVEYQCRVGVSKSGECPEVGALP